MSMKLHPNKPVKSQQSMNLNDSIVVFHKYVLLIFLIHILFIIHQGI